MRTWFSAWRKGANVYQPRDDVVKEFDFAEPVSEAGDRFRFREKGYLFSYRYEWSISSVNGAYRVTEDAFVSWVWLIISTGCFFGTCASLTLFVIFQGIYQLVVFSTTFLLLIGFVASFSIIFQKKSPVNQLINDGSDFRQYMPAATFLIPSFLLLVVVLIAPVVIKFAALVSLAIVFAVYSLRHEAAFELSLRWQGWIIDKTGKIPLVVGQYTAAIFLSMMPPLFFLMNHESTIFVVFMQETPYLQVLVLGSLIFAFLWILRDNLLYDIQLSEVNRFRRGGRNIRTRHAILLTALIAVGASLLFGYLSIQFAVEGIAFIERFQTIPAAALIFLAGLPILYFFAGLAYQLYTAIVGTITLYYQAEQKDFSEIYETKANVYVLDTETLIAGAASIGRRDAIILSKQLEEALEPKELAAILAHEESHIENKENRIASVIALFSPILLTAKNVLYAIFDFRNREYRADRDASRKTDSQDLVNALQSIQVLKARQKAEKTEKFEKMMPTLTSFTDQRDHTGFWKRYFGLFFGEFAIAEAHPSISDRIKKIREN